MDQKLSQGRDEATSSVVTFKGRRIGPPELISPLNILPPASRFVKQPQDTYLSVSTESPLKNGYKTNGIQLLSTSQHDQGAQVESPSLPPPSALLATPSRPATINPFAGIYGNPSILRAGPAPPPVDHTIAGIPVGRPSALDGLQTGYDQVPALRGRPSLRDSHEILRHISERQRLVMRPTARKTRTDRRWAALPALPRKEGLVDAPLKDITTCKEEDDDKHFDTEEVLNSLQPERLSLYHISLPGRPTDDLANADHDSAATKAWPAQAIASDTRKLTHDNVDIKAIDNHSIRTREWDLQSCDTDDLAIDSRLEKQKQFAQRVQKRRLSQEQWRQANVRDNNEPLNGLPAPTPESLFYTELIDIVKDRREQLQRVIQRAYEAGEMSEDQWLREKWRHRTAMEKKLQAAEAMSGYRILTLENDIKEAIKQATGYAIYGSLLEIRDPETWQRIFEPVSTPLLPRPVATVKPHVDTREKSLTWLARKAGRALRFMLAVSDDPSLKTYSSRHPPPKVITYQSPVGVLGPNIPSRPHHIERSTISDPLLTSLRQDVPVHDNPRSSTPTLRLPEICNDTNRGFNNNALFTGSLLASPPNGRFIRAQRSRGYEQGVFVTVVSPSVVSTEIEKTTSGYTVGKLGNRQRAEDDESRVTTWPKAEW